MTTDTLSDLPAVLAQVCGYHTGPGCEHCAEALAYRRERGWTDEQILADALLFRDDYPTWYANLVAEVGAAGAQR